MAQGVMKSYWRSGGEYLFQTDHDIWGKGSDFLRYRQRNLQKKGMLG